MYSYPTTHKKRPSTEDQDALSYGLPRKRFISEENFANDMAAMTLSSLQQSQEQPSQANYQQYGIMQYSLPSNNKNVIHINDVDQFLNNEEEEDVEVIDASHVVYTSDDGKQSIVENGLPLEWAPGDKKPRIPDFVLAQSEFRDPRDKLAFQKYLKLTGVGNKRQHVEVLNKPTIHTLQSSMEID